FADLLDENFRRGGSRSQTHTGNACKPLHIDVLGGVEQFRFDAAAMRDLHQAVGIRAVRRAHYQDQVHVLCHLLARFLAGLGGVAYVVAGWTLDKRKLLPQPRDNFLRVVEAQGRLSKEREFVGVFDFESVHSGYGIYHNGAIRGLTGGTHDLLMVPVADENNGALFTGKLERLEMHLGDQRAGGVNYFQLARLGFLANSRWNAMGAENQYSAVWHFLDGFHKNGAAAAQLLYYVSVMDDFVVHVDWRSIGLQRQ